MNEIILFRFTVTPWGNSQISSADYYIVAKSRKEAELIFLEQGYKFLDLDHHVTVKEELRGYQQ